MQRGKLVASLALATLAVAAAGPLGARDSPSVRTHYEVTLQKGRSTWTTGAAADVTSGAPISHDMGPYRLSLVPRLESSGHYTLDVSVGRIPHGAGALYAPDHRTFAGRMGFPLEFSTTLAGATVTGAIMVARVRKVATPASAP